MTRNRSRSIWIVAVTLVFLVWLQLLGCAGSSPRGSNGVEHINPREVMIRLDLAEAYLRNAEPRLSLQELTRIRAAAGAMPRYHFVLGYTYFLLGHREDAVTAYQTAVALDPDHAEAWNNLGLAYLAVDNFKDAEAAFTRALSVPTYHTPEIAALNLALLSMEQNDPIKARRYVDLTLELNWRFGRAYLLAAELEAGQGDLDKAVEILERGVAADLNNTRLMLTLAEYLLLVGKTRDARLWLERVLVAVPQDSPEAAMVSEYLRSLDRGVGAAGSDVTMPALVGGAARDSEVFAVFRSAVPSAPGPGSGDAHAGTKEVQDVDQSATYIAQIGAFMDQGKAKVLRERYAVKGYPAGIAEILHLGSTWFVVFIDSAADKEQAQLRADQFQKQENIPAVVTRIGMGRYLERDTP